MSMPPQTTERSLRDRFACLRHLSWFELFISELALEVAGWDGNEFVALNAAAIWIQSQVEPNEAREALATLFLKQPLLVLSGMVPEVEAQDLASIALLQFLKIWPTEWQRAGARATSLLRTITLRRALEAIRKTQRQRTDPLDDERLTTLEAPSSSDATPHEFSPERMSALQECIESLSLVDRDMISDFHIVGLSSAEIARAHHFTDVATRARLSRIRREQLKPCIESKLSAL